MLALSMVWLYFLPFSVFSLFQRFCCLHLLLLRSFDLATYVQYCVSRHCWNCPVCHEPTPHQAVSYCGRLQICAKLTVPRRLCSCVLIGSFRICLDGQLCSAVRWHFGCIA